LKLPRSFFLGFPRLLPGLLAEVSSYEMTFTHYWAPHTKIEVPLFFIIRVKVLS
jgi:hypothetical protein